MIQPNKMRTESKKRKLRIQETVKITYNHNEKKSQMTVGQQAQKATNSNQKRKSEERVQEQNSFPQQLIYYKAGRCYYHKKKNKFFSLNRKKAIRYYRGGKPFGPHMKEIKYGMILSGCQSLRQVNPFNLDTWNILLWHRYYIFNFRILIVQLASQ